MVNKTKGFSKKYFMALISTPTGFHDMGLGNQVGSIIYHLAAATYPTDQKIKVQWVHSWHSNWE